MGFGGIKETLRNLDNDIILYTAEVGLCHCFASQKKVSSLFTQVAGPKFQVWSPKKIITHSSPNFLDLLSPAT